MKCVAIFGASGLVGSAAVERFSDRDDYRVLAISRRRPEINSATEFTHLPLDLRDGDEVRRTFAEVPPVTHVVYAALHEVAGLVAGWRSTEQMQTNLMMFANALTPIVNRGQLRHVSLMQGTKAYGSHVHDIPVPAREREPRDSHENAYWLQEDHLRAAGNQHGFSWTILRPPLIVGGSVGVAMNVAPVIGAYGAICRELGRAFSYPGGASYVWEAIDSRICAGALEWAAETPGAANEIFNVSNGDVFEWRHLWPTLADALGVPYGDDQPMSMPAFFAEHVDTWKALAAKHELRCPDLPSLIGMSHYYADRCFAYGQATPYTPKFMSTIKIRSAGFAEFADTESSFLYWLDWLARRGYLPELDDARIAQSAS